RRKVRSPHLHRIPQRRATRDPRRHGKLEGRPHGKDRQLLRRPHRWLRQTVNGQGGEDLSCPSALCSLKTCILSRLLDQVAKDVRAPPLDSGASGTGSRPAGTLRPAATLRPASFTQRYLGGWRGGVQDGGDCRGRKKRG